MLCLGSANESQGSASGGVRLGKWFALFREGWINPSNYPENKGGGTFKRTCEYLDMVQVFIGRSPAHITPAVMRTTVPILGSRASAKLSGKLARTVSILADGRTGLLSAIPNKGSWNWSVGMSTTMAGHLQRAPPSPVLISARLLRHRFQTRVATNRFTRRFFHLAHLAIRRCLWPRLTINSRAVCSREFSVKPVMNTSPVIRTPWPSLQPCTASCASPSRQAGNAERIAHARSHL